MKNFFIFLSILVVVALAGLDVKQRFEELDSVAVKSPAQVEINQDMLKPSRERTRNYTNQIDENATKRENTLFNDRVRKYNLNTNDPIEKQKNKD